jgi:hypothetical protein
MNWKIIFVGGLVYYVAMFAASMLTGPIIHEGILADAYRETAAFWRPELNAIPPQRMALMKIWLPTWLLSCFLVAGIYSVVRQALKGPAWQRGLKYGVITLAFCLINAMGYWGVFGLPTRIWEWWMVSAAFLHLAGATVLGVVAQKLAPVAA